MYGLDCRGGCDNVTTYEKLRWLQSQKECNCTVTSTWSDTDGRGDCHTWRAWGSRIREKQIVDNFWTSRSSFCDVVSGLHTWDHFLVVVRIDGKELRTRRRVRKAGRAGFLNLKLGNLSSKTHALPRRDSGSGERRRKRRETRRSS